MTTDPTKLAYLQRATPSLPPEAHVAIAGQPGSVSDALITAQSISGYGDAVTQANLLRQMSGDEQRHMWETSNSSQRAMWSGAGYDVPKRNRGLLSRAVHDVLGAPSAVYRQGQDAFSKIPYVGGAGEQIGHGLTKGVGEVFNAAGAGTRLTAHMYRTGQMMNQEANRGPLADNIVGNFVAGQLGAIGAGAKFLHLTDDEDWADAWHKTTYGERTFDPHRDRDIRDQSGFSEQEIGLAKALAGGDKEAQRFFTEQVNAGMNADEAAALQERSLKDDFKDVVQQYKDAHMSFGRSLVPQALWDDYHPLATFLSGTGDLLYSFADPLYIGGKLNKASKIKNYAFRSPEEIQAILAKPQADRWLNDVTPYLQKKDYAGLLERHPQFAPVLSKIAQDGLKTKDDLARGMVPSETTDVTKAYAAEQEARRRFEDTKSAVASGMPDSEYPADAEAAIERAFREVGLTEVATKQELAKWTEGNMLALHILAGNGTAINHGVTMVPTLTRAGKVALDAKGIGKQVVDWAADKQWDFGEGALKTASGATWRGTVNLVGKTGRRILTLNPHVRTMDPTDPNSVTTIQRFASAYLPAQAVRVLVNRWVGATDVAEKQAIYMEMLGQTAKAAGFDLSDDATLMNHFVDTVQRGIVKQKYSPLGNDRMLNVDGMEEATGFLEKHLTTEWGLPPFKELYAQAHRNRAMKMIYGLHSNKLADSFINAWKPAQLFRLAYPVRNAAEEIFGAALRERPQDLIRASMARTTTAEITGGTMHGPLSDFNPMEAGVSRLLRQLEAKDRIKAATSVRNFQAKVLAGRVNQVRRSIYGRMPGVAAIEDTVRRYSDSLFSHGLSGEVSSIETGRLSSFAGDPNEVADILHDGLTKTRLNFTPRLRVKPNGDWMDYDPGEPGYMASWMKHLDDAAGSDLARVALQNIDLPEDQLVAKVVDYISSPAMEGNRKLAKRAIKTRDGRYVGIDATEEEAFRDWADVVINHVRTIIPDQTTPEDILMHRARRGDYEAEKEFLAPRHKELTKLKAAFEGISQWHKDPALKKQFGAGEPEYLAGIIKKNFSALPHGVKVFLNKNGRDVEHIRGYLDEFGQLEGRIGKLDSNIARANVVNDKEQLIDHLLKNSAAPDMKFLMRIDREFRPKQVVGPEFVEMPFNGVEGVLSEFVQRGFQRMGWANDYMSRQPIYVLAVHKADQQIRPVFDELFGAETPMAKELTEAVVKHRADSETLQFLDNPRIRSQMNVITRNLAPFQHAQDQFVKRWAKTFIHSPEALREAELAHHALGATGVTHKNDQGNEVFTYPASGHVQRAIAATFDKMGIPAYLPVQQAFTGQLRMAAPGFNLDQTFTPSYGPLVSVSLNAAARQFHELQPLEHKMLGDLGSDRPLWELVVPASISRLVNAAIASDEISPAYAGAQMKAIQDLAAADPDGSKGIFLRPDSTPLEIEEFFHRVKNWTRINMFTRTILGVAVPASPQAEIGDTEIGKQLRQLSASGLNFSEAMQALTARNPNAFPYAVFMSEGAGKQPLPATAAAARMLESNTAFFKKHKDAGGYFLPQKSSDDTFSSQAYKEQLLYEMRRRRSPTEYLEQIMYSQGAQDYFDTSDFHKKQVKNLSGPAKQEAENKFGLWKDGYMKEHPVFAEQMQLGTGRVKRQTTLDSLRRALGDGTAPQGQQTESIRDLVDTYDAYIARSLVWKGMTSSRAETARKNERDHFARWAKDYVARKPEALDVYNGLIRMNVEEETI